MKPLLLLLALLPTACADYPRDAAGTLDRVRAEQILRVGVVAGEVGPAERTRLDAYIAAVGRATGARPEMTTGPAEPLLLQLERGSIDLAIGAFSEESPWATEVAIIEPLAVREADGGRVALNAVARNGENGWILLLEREARNLGAGQ
jgi:hypothetical protein